MRLLTDKGYVCTWMLQDRYDSRAGSCRVLWKLLHAHVNGCAYAWGQSCMMLI
jgi:hypothetical protein